jgi:hypothetical protein
MKENKQQKDSTNNDLSEFPVWHPIHTHSPRTLSYNISPIPFSIHDISSPIAAPSSPKQKLSNKPVFIIDNPLQNAPKTPVISVNNQQLQERQSISPDTIRIRHFSRTNNVQIKQEPLVKTEQITIKNEKEELIKNEQIKNEDQDNIQNKLYILNTSMANFP